ncbi:hypothetical protein SH611_10965 [Geminicoccaceae bacterium 1502E]|nr:hypothetical protein [Geminicoccaceae bacterium 1502E]
MLLYSLSWRLACLLLATALCPPAAGAASMKGIGQAMAAPGPIVLKDGRMALMRLLEVPFAQGAAQPALPVAAELAAVAAELADDCFLTAQVIGHAVPGEEAEGPPLAAHRLARARAEAVRAALLAQGLPDDAVATAWDWQFSRKESRATLWLIARPPGIDCSGTAMEAAAKPVSAEPATPAPPPPAAVSAEATLAGPAPRAVPPQPDPALPEASRMPEPDYVGAEEPVAAEAAVAGSTAPAPAGSEQGDAAATAASTAVGTPPSPPPSSGTAAVAPAGNAGADVPVAADETIQGESAPSTALLGRVVPDAAEQTMPGAASGEPAEELVEALDAAAAGLPTDLPAAGTAVVFAVNSSFFGTDGEAVLEGFLEALPAEGPVALELLASIGPADVPGAGVEKALAYNRWLAERRAGRVAEWLREHGGARSLDIAIAYRDNDPGRQVLLTRRQQAAMAAPAGGS